MSLIRISGLTLRFPGQAEPVLRDIHLELNRGERALLLGPSGSGKSSLLLAMTGLTPRSIEAEVTGQVLVDGQPAATLSPDEVCRRVGLLFQEPDSQFCMLYPDDEVAFGLENLGVPAAEMGARVERALSRVDLGAPQRQTRIDRLSGGQQQRLALASVLAQEPDLLLLDEPTANLDPLGRREVVSAAAAAAQNGKGLLVVEHNLEPWLPLLNRVIILTADGRLLDDGPPADLFARWGRYLDEAGIWRPRATRVADVLAKAGAPCTPYPLTPADLRQLSVPESQLRAAVEQTEIGNQEPAPPPQHTPQPEPIVTISSLTVGYGQGAPVLRDINLQVQAGEFWALLGPNGSGKSTLARTLIGMVQPIGGTVELLGREVSRLNPRTLAERAGYVFQNPEHQFVTDSVWEELAFSVRQRQLEPNERRTRIEEALAFFGLDGLMAANPFSLSGGQKRRLSVATMLVGGQRLLILDEPTFGQDQRSAERLMERIARLHRQGITILMITHDLDLVDRYADRAAVLLNGQVAFSGPPRDLWLQPDLLARCHLEPPFRMQVLADPLPVAGGIA